MSSTSVALHLAGSLGLVLLGGLVATEGFRCVALRLWGDVVASGRRKPIRAFRSGLCTALVLPSTTPLAGGALAVGESNVIGVAGAMLFACGLSLGALVSMIWALFAAVTPLSRDVACAMIAAGAGMHWFAGARPLGARGEVIAGAGLAMFGMHELARAFAEIGALGRLDAWNATFLVKLAFLLVAGGALAVWLRSSSAVCALAVAAVAGGALELPSGAGLAIGGFAGFVRPAIRVLQRSNADGRRVASGLVLHHAAALGAGLLGIPWLLPLASRLDSAPWMRATALTALMLASVSASTLVIVSLAGPIANFLDRCFGEHEQGAGRPSPLVPELAFFPALAFEGGIERLRQLGVLVRTSARSALGGSQLTETRREVNRQVVDELVRSLEVSFETLGARRGPRGLAQRVPQLVEWVRGLRSLAERLWNLTDRSVIPLAGLAQPFPLRIKQLEMQCLHLVEGLNPDTPDSAVPALAGELEHLRMRGRDLVRRGVEACASHGIGSDQMLALIERVSLLEELGRTVVETACGVVPVAAPRGALPDDSPPSLVSEPARTPVAGTFYTGR